MDLHKVLFIEWFLWFIYGGFGFCSECLGGIRFSGIIELFEFVFGFPGICLCGVVCFVVCFSFYLLS